MTTSRPSHLFGRRQRPPIWREDLGLTDEQLTALANPERLDETWQLTGESGECRQHFRSRSSRSRIRLPITGRVLAGKIAWLGSVRHSLNLMVAPTVDFVKKSAAWTTSVRKVKKLLPVNWPARPDSCIEPAPSTFVQESGQVQFAALPRERARSVKSKRLPNGMCQHTHTRCRDEYRRCSQVTSVVHTTSTVLRPSGLEAAAEHPEVRWQTLLSGIH